MKFFFRDDVLVAEDTRECSILTNKIKLVVPLELVPQVFALTHESLAACHQGFQKTIDRIREHFYWSGMSTHVRNLVDSCVSCQQKRAHRANQLAPLQRMPTPEYPLSKVHCDILGPLKTTFSGNKYIVAYIDSFSKWPEAYAVSSITSDVIADTLADFISRYGAPKCIVTDNASNLISQGIKKVYEQFGIRHITTSPYHAAGNAQVERQHKTLSNALSHIVHENHSDWDTKLKFALLAMRTAVHSSTKLTPAAVMFGRNLNLPYSIFSQPPQINYNDAPSFCELLIPALQKVYSEVHNNLIKVSENQEKYREKSAVNKDIKIGDAVWLFTPVVHPDQCRKFVKQNSGPFTVIEKLNNVNFKISLISNPKIVKVTHVDFLTKVTSRMSFPTSDIHDNTPAEEMSIGNQPANVDTPVENQRVLRPRRKQCFVFPVVAPTIPDNSQSTVPNDVHTGEQGTQVENIQESSHAQLLSQTEDDVQSVVSETDTEIVSEERISPPPEVESGSSRSEVESNAGSSVSIHSEMTDLSSKSESKREKRELRERRNVGSASRYNLRNRNESSHKYRF